MIPVVLSRWGDAEGRELAWVAVGAQAVVAQRAARSAWDGQQDAAPPKWP